MFENANLKIEQMLQAGWTTTPIDFDNVTYSPKRGVPWVRLQVEWTSTNSVSIGGLDRGEGYVDLSIFVPTNTGTITANRMADSIAEIYEKVQDGGLKFKVGRTQRIGQQEEWYQLKVLIPFTYDECN